MKIWALKATVIWMLLLSINVAPVAAQADFGEFLSSLEGNKAVSGIDRFPYKEDLYAPEICRVRIRMSTGQTLEETTGHTWDELVQMGLHNSDNLPSGRSYTFNAPDMSFCGGPPGGVTVAEPAPQPKPADETQQSAPVIIPSSLPSIQRADPVFLAAIITSVGPWLLVLATFALFSRVTRACR